MMFAPERLNVSDEWTYTTGAAASPPQITPVEDQRLPRNGGNVNIDLNAYDPNGGTITWSRQSGPTWCTIVTVSGQKKLRIATNNRNVGRYNLVIRATDSGGLYDEDQIVITIFQPNRQPVMSAISAKTVQEGQQLRFTVTASDPDGDVLSYSIQSDDGEGGTLNTLTGVFTWTPVSDGTRNMTFRATDPDGLYAERSVAITITDPPPDPSPPTLSEIGNRARIGAGRITIQLTATDPDSLAIQSFHATRNNATYGTIGTISDNEDGSYSATWTSPQLAAPSGSQTVRTYEVSFRARASGGTPANEYSAYETITITVNKNLPPRLSAIGNRKIRQGATLTITLTASDPENDTLEFRKQSGVGSISGSTYTYSPGSATGNKPVTIRVRQTGNHNNYDEETFTITILLALPTPPTWDTTPADITRESTDANAWLEHNILATDPNNLPITYARVSPNDNNQLRILTRTDGTKYVRYRLPAADAQRTYTIRATATGGIPSNERIEHTWTATVNAPVIVDRPPVMGMNPSSASERRGRYWQTTLKASDPDGDAITWSVTRPSTVPANSVSLGVSTGVFRWTIPNNQAFGNYSFVVKATAGGKSVSHTITITVQRETPPVFVSAPADITFDAIDAGTTKRTTVIASDPSRHAPTFSVVSGSAQFTGLTSQVTGTDSYQRSFSFDLPAAGESESITIRASHDGESTDHTFTVTVNETDYRPNITITLPPPGQRNHTRPTSANGVLRVEVTATRYNGDKIPLGDLDIDAIPDGTGTYNGRSYPRVFANHVDVLRRLTHGNQTVTVSYNDTINNRSYSATDSVTVIYDR